MFLLQQRPNHWQFAQYFHFAEPYPRGVIVAYADTVLPDDELASAAEALRSAEVESVQTDEPADELESSESEQSFDTASDLSPPDALQSIELTEADLESMSIDDVRALAAVLDIPDRGVITEKLELIHEVLRRL